MESVIQWLLLITVISISAANERQPSAEPSDITSINSLKNEHDIEVMILRVLKKIKDESGSLPEDFPHSDYIHLLSTHQAEAEDLGSVEVIGQQSMTKELMANNGQFGEKITDTKTRNKKHFGREARTEIGNSNFEKYYISPVDSDKSSSDQQYYQKPSDNSKKEPTLNTDVPEVSQEANTPPEGEEEAVSEREIGLQPKKLAVLEETTTIQQDIPTDFKPQSQEDDFEGYKDETDTNVQDVPTNSKPQGRERFQEENEFEGYRDDETTEQDSEKADNIAITKYTNSINGNNEPMEQKKNDSEENYYQVETPQNQKPTENQPDTNMEFNNEQEQNKYPVEYEYIPALESNLVPTKPTPSNDIFAMGPTPIDIPDAQYQEDEITTPTHLSPNRNTANVSNGESEKKSKYENVHHEVDFAPSPLVAAFTVQQDEKGIPRKIVPLDYVHPPTPPAPTENPETVAYRQRDLEEKEFILYQQLKSLQEEKHKYISPEQKEQERLRRLQREEEIKQQQLQIEFQRQKELQRQEELKNQELKRQQLLYANQNYYQQTYQHSPEYIQQEQLRQQEYQRQLEYLRYQELQRQKQQHYRNNVNSPQGIEFHKSVDYSLPQYEHNRVNRREPTNYVGNHGVNKPYSVSGQIQNLINTAGISSGLPRNTQADLSVVSKILALNHGGLEQSHNTVYNKNHNFISY